MILAKLPNDFDFATLSLNGAIHKDVIANHKKYKGHEIAEFILDGMAFELTLWNIQETRQFFDKHGFNTLFCEQPGSQLSAIRIAPGDNIVSGRHLSAVNQRLLQLGMFVGMNLDATLAAWSPSKAVTSFEYYCETVQQYCDGGPFPALIQNSIDCNAPDQYQTKGLDYFANQEIRLTTPPDMKEADVTKRIIRLVHDVAMNGKIDSYAKSEGIQDGEILTFSPSDDLKFVDVAIEYISTDSVLTKN